MNLRTLMLSAIIALLTSCATSTSTSTNFEHQALFRQSCAEIKKSSPLFRQKTCIGPSEINTHKEGLWCCFDSADHLIMASEFHDGLKQGRTELYSAADAHLETISTWENGQLEGQQIIFNHNGTLSGEYSLHDGSFIGALKDYDENGTLLSTHHYKNGVCLDPEVNP